MIKGSTENDVMTEREHDHLILDILRGRFKIVGTYPEATYDIEEDDSSADYIRDAIQTVQEQKLQVEQDIETLSNQYAWMIQHLTEEYPYILRKMCKGFTSETGDNLISKKYLQEIEIPTMDTELPPILQDYLETQKRNDDEEYGWLEPNGTFHPISWGEHAKWAATYLAKHYPVTKYPKLYWHDFPKQGRKHIVNGNVLVYKLG